MDKIDRLGWAAGLPVSTYGHRIGVRANNEHTLERALSCLPPGWKPLPNPEVDCMYSVLRGGDTGRVRRFNLLYRGAARILRTHNVDELFATLEEDLKLHVATAAKSRVFVHAGVVGWRGQAIIMPGPTHAGKSTLVAALVRAGATYYSDEYAVLDPRGRVHPYARPIMLRTRPGEQPASSIEVRAPRRSLPVRAVAIVRYEAGAGWRVRALSPGHALMALMENTVAMRSRPEAALRTLREVVGRAVVLAGVRGDTAEAVEHILNI